MGARSTSSRAALGGRGVGAHFRAMGGCKGARYQTSQKVPCALWGSRLRLSGLPVGLTRTGRKFPLGSFHSEVSTRGSSCRSCTDRSASIGSRRHVYRAAVGAFLACTPRLLSPEVHRTLADRRGAQRAGGSVLRERCVRRGRRRPAPRHSKGAHAAARVRRSLCSKRPRAPFVTRPARAALRCSG